MLAENSKIVVTMTLPTGNLALQGQTLKWKSLGRRKWWRLNNSWLCHEVSHKTILSYCYVSQFLYKQEMNAIHAIISYYESNS